MTWNPLKKPALCQKPALSQELINQASKQAINQASNQTNKQLFKQANKQTPNQLFKQSIK